MKKFLLIISALLIAGCVERSPEVPKKELSIVRIDGVRCAVARSTYYDHVNAVSCDWATAHDD